ncbi:hypothetical protein O181_025439 [Austropuccinia psidii MF-1]|uniref:Cyanovirin-N domain-containing protein n=1 Tax=Austropuccinia psidii MF-1 TaxID=1389203 RepID=A0A9Q3H0M6_9BASI|nr:hypothetical protein [Austropuccinia psidii MF-1]
MLQHYFLKLAVMLTLISGRLAQESCTLSLSPNQDGTVTCTRSDQVNFKCQAGSCNGDKIYLQNCNGANGQKKLYPYVWATNFDINSFDKVVQVYGGQTSSQISGQRAKITERIDCKWSGDKDHNAVTRVSCGQCQR